MNVEKELAVLAERLEAMREARDLQHKEYSRRLDELNHARARDDADKHKFVTEAVFTVELKGVSARLEDLERWRSKILGIHIGIASLAGIAGALITALLLKLLQ